MYVWLWTVPVVSCLAGWMMGLAARRMLINRVTHLLPELVSNTATRLFTKDNIRSAILDKGNSENIMPLIETHVDNFMHHRLGKAMPMIGMFIGDKTITQLKTIFMKELREIFPEVMNKYVDDLTAGFHPETFISQKISSVPPMQLKAIITSSLAGELKMISAGTAVAGLLIGLLQLLMFMVVT